MEAEHKEKQVSLRHTSPANHSTGRQEALAALNKDN